MPTLTFITEPVLLPNWEHCIRQYLVSNHGRTAKKVMGEVKVIRVVKNWFSGAKAACIWVKGMRPTFVPLWVFVDFEQTLKAQAKQAKTLVTDTKAIAETWDDELRYIYKQALLESNDLGYASFLCETFFTSGTHLSCEDFGKHHDAVVMHGESIIEAALEFWQVNYEEDFYMQCPQLPEPELLPGELPGYSLADQKAEAESIGRDLWVGDDKINFIEWQKQELSVSKFFRHCKREKAWLQCYVPAANDDCWEDIYEAIAIEWHRYRRDVLNKRFGEWAEIDGYRAKRFHDDQFHSHPIPAYVFEGARQAIAETIEAIKPVTVKATPLGVVKGFSKK